MKKEEVIKLLDEKGDAEYIVRTADEDKTFLENYGKEIEEKIIPGKIGEVHRQYDEDLYALIGKRKQPTEKTYDFMKREVAHLKEKAEAVDSLLSEKQELERKIKEGSTDKKLIADLEKVQKEYESLKAESETNIKRVNSEFDRYKIRSHITEALTGMSFSDKVPDGALNALKNTVIEELVGMAEFKDGSLVFIDKDGSPLRNRNNALHPYTAKELLTEKLKEVIRENKRSSGPSVSDEIVKEYDKGGKVTKIALVVPDSIKTKGELGDYLVSKGLLRGSQEYYLAYAEYGQNLPMR